MQCQKPDPLYSLEVQDHPGHVMLLQKAICSYTTSNEIGGDKAKDSYGVSMADATATHAVASGTHVVSYESGDKTFSSFRGTANGSDGKFAGNQGTWTYTGGTGKFKGIKGKGTYKTTTNPDGTSTVEFEGEYELTQQRASAKK
jgi:hypothetical protein